MMRWFHLTMVCFSWVALGVSVGLLLGMGYSASHRSKAVTSPSALMQPADTGVPTIPEIAVHN